MKDLQVYAMPVFGLLEKMMVKRLNFPPGVALRLVARSAYVGEFVLHNHTTFGIRWINALEFCFYVPLC